MEDQGKRINYEVPYEGSLGLLALGVVGLKAWRKKRKEVDSQAKPKNRAAGK